MRSHELSSDTQSRMFAFPFRAHLSTYQNEKKSQKPDIGSDSKSGQTC